MTQNFFSSEELDAALTDAFPSIWRFAIVLTRNQPDADDLAQATCLRALERRKQFERHGQFRAWCITICRSIWLNDLRAKKIRKTQGIDSVPEAALEALIPDAVSNIFASEVFKAVMELPEAQRETVLLVYVEGYRYSEVARILNVPIGTVMSRLSAARHKLAHLNSEDQQRRGEG